MQVETTEKRLFTFKKVYEGSKPFLYGGIAGMVATTVIQPIDMIKVSIQVHGKGGTTNPLVVARNLIAQDGFFSLYRGLSAGLLRQATYTTARMGIFRTVSNKLKGEDGSLTFAKRALAGLIAGGLGSIIGTPCDLALIRMQADSSLPLQERRNYRNVFDALLRITKEEGVLGLWSGCIPTVARAMALNVGMLATYDQSKDLLEAQFGKNGATSFASSAVAGFFASAFSLPFDFVKTRIQKMKPDVNGKLPYSGSVDCAIKVAQAEGPMAFYKGFWTFYPLLSVKNSNIELSDTWQVLGPFPHGSRELGVDLLSSYGGFENLKYSTSDKYPSELVDGGYTTWKTVKRQDDGSIGGIEFDNVRWEFNAKTLGWAAYQHGIYFRSTFRVEEEGSYLFSFNGPITFKIDETAYPGNVYSYPHASDSAVYLEEGVHSIFVYSVLDVRIHGDFVPPKISFTGTITKVNEEVDGGLIAYPKDAIFPEILENKWISPYASVTIKNGYLGLPFHSHKRNEYDQGWKQVLNVIVLDKNQQNIKVDISELVTIMLAPGQVSAIPFKFQNIEAPKSPITVKVQVLDVDSKEIVDFEIGNFDLISRNEGEAFKITMDGYDSAIQYAFVRTPKYDCALFTNKKCPVVVALHGAGVEVSNQFWLDAVLRQDYAWVVYPTGRTPWGFDWHGPSFKNIEATLEALVITPGYIKHSQELKGVDTDRLVVAGHSNGGQGTWWFASHYPDKVLACVPASGFMKIQIYAPYFLHTGYSYTDPMMRGIMEASISENDLDLYAANLGGLPLLARVGGDDTNVPPYHTRRLVRMVDEWSGELQSTKYVEDPGKGHWFEGILNDQVVQPFIAQYTSPLINPDLHLPSLPNPFTITTLNPASSGSRGGIKILQLIVPFRVAKIRVDRLGAHWKLSTTNVRRFGFARDHRQDEIDTWSIDGTQFNSPPNDAGPSYLKVGDKWELAADLLWISRERNPTTYGPTSLIFSQPFRIVIPSSPSANLSLYTHLAQHISTSWYMYGRGSVQIIKDVDVLDGVTARYNLIVLGDPRDNVYTLRRTQGGASKLVTFLPDGGLQIADRVYDQPGTGAVFLAPSPARTRLCLFVTGVDYLGLLRALWTIPFQTGVQVPDYMIVGEEYGDPSSGWTAVGGSPTKGSGGILAAGFWNNTWEFDPSAGYLH
ncbi:hypothetical protein HDV06_003635 [Boothiomyces sp. JEL0866]|nr:hypothetical protein HDV06_003635 [Boothiomyces sp. JEL0866]